MSDKKFYYLLLSFAIIGLTVYFVIFPLIGNINDNNKALRDKRVELANQEQKYEILKKLGGENTTTKEMSTKIGNLWPENKEISNFIVSLENLGKSEGVTFNNLSITEPIAKTKSKKTPKETAQSVQFSFDTTSSYATIVDIIKNLEKFERYNAANTVGISNKSDGTVGLSLTGNIFYGK